MVWEKTQPKNNHDFSKSYLRKEKKGSESYKVGEQKKTKILPAKAFFFLATKFSAVQELTAGGPQKVRQEEISLRTKI